MFLWEEYILLNPNKTGIFEDIASLLISFFSSGAGGRGRGGSGVKLTHFLQIPRRTYLLSIQLYAIIKQYIELISAVF